MTDRVQAAATQRAAAESTRRVRVLLVDDQPMIGEAVRRMLAPETDIDFMYCGDPTKAMEAAAEFGPTVILQDLVMPEIDGLTMLRFYRANPATREIPTIVLSTKEEPKVKAEAFMLGANDYLVKLPDPIELTARIRHHSRGYIAQIERNEAYAALKQSEERLAEELAQAAKYVDSLLPQRLSGEITTEWLFIPVGRTGRRRVRIPLGGPDHFAMYLLDVCGHGVQSGAAVYFGDERSSQSGAGRHRLPLADRGARGLNKVFQMDRNNDMYFTMWYGVYDKEKRRLTYANGGHPPRSDGGTSEETAEPLKLSKPGTIIGAFPDMTFHSEAMDLPKFSRLYVFSDGIYEVARPDGTMMKYSDFADILAASKHSAGSVIEQTFGADSSRSRRRSVRRRRVDCRGDVLMSENKRFSPAFSSPIRNELCIACAIPPRQSP
jgi:sigma-B regulation protein RsbU (phosphoserine phosphatase)